MGRHGVRLTILHSLLETVSTGPGSKGQKAEKSERNFPTKVKRALLQSFVIQKYRRLLVESTYHLFRSQRQINGAVRLERIGQAWPVNCTKNFNWFQRGME